MVVSSKMFLQLSKTLNTTMFSRNLAFGCSRLSHIRTITNPHHVLVPALDVRYQSHFSQSPLATGASKAVTASTLCLNRNQQSRACNKNLFSRGFNTSACRAAKELSDKGDLVYTGAISGMIKGVKLFSLSTSALGICLQPALINSTEQLPAALKLVMGGMVSFFVFVNPFIIHFIAKKYVTELRWNSATGVFTAVTMSFFARRRELQFTAKDVKVPEIPGMFTFLEAKGTPLFMDPKYFQDKEAYIQLMGYDKPLDWEMPPKKDS